MSDVVPLLKKEIYWECPNNFFWGAGDWYPVEKWEFKEDNIKNSMKELKNSMDILATFEKNDVLLALKIFRIKLDDDYWKYGEDDKLTIEGSYLLKELKKQFDELFGVLPEEKEVDSP
jgi:hypothetical protein